jgi:hypothetical protein
MVATLIFIFQMVLVQIRRHVTRLFGDQSNATVILGANFSAGFIAGVISAGATCPLDVAKTRRQIEASARVWASYLHSKFSFSLSTTCLVCLCILIRGQTIT